MYRLYIYTWHKQSLLVVGRRCPPFAGLNPINTQSCFIFAICWMNPRSWMIRFHIIVIHFWMWAPWKKNSLFHFCHGFFRFEKTGMFHVLDAFPKVFARWESQISILRFFCSGSLFERIVSKRPGRGQSNSLTTGIPHVAGLESHCKYRLVEAATKIIWGLFTHTNWYWLYIHNQGNKCTDH